MKIAGRRERNYIVIDEGKYKGKKALVLKKVERQLIIYKYLASGRLLEREDVLHLYDIPTSTIYKDIQDIEDSGYIKLKYNENNRLYEESNEKSTYNENEDRPNHRAHIKRLARLIWCMRFLFNDLPEIDYDENGKPYIKQEKTCADYYMEQFSDESIRTMNRDFETLTRIGYVVKYNRVLGRYDFFDDDFYTWEDYPWCYGVFYSKKYGLCKLIGEEYDMPIQDNLEEETLAIKNGTYEENW